MAAIGPRSSTNKAILGVYFAAYAVLPGIAAVWATTLEESIVPPLAGVVRVALIFLVLPVYFIYLGISVGRFFPRRFPAALASLIPAVFTVAAALVGGVGSRSIALLFLQIGTPLFVGFMTLLAVGLVVLAVGEMRGERAPWGPALVLVVILVLAYAPVVHVAVTGVRVALGPGTPDAPAAVEFFFSIGLVVAFHVGAVQRLHHEGRL